MKKLITLCVGAMLLVTTLGVAGVARAQTGSAASGPFADVPTDHWAYQAVDTLQKAGIVIGYPDGTYGGRRAMTRYEFAEAIARLLPLINSNAASKSDLDALQQEMENRLSQDEQAQQALKALVDEFAPELQQMGQDIDAIKARLDDMENRLAVVEAEQRRVKVTADLNVITRGLVNTSNNNTANLDQDGYRVGSAGKDDLRLSAVRTPSPSTSISNLGNVGDASTPFSNSGGFIGGNTSLWNDINIYNDLLLTIDGRVSDNAHAILKLEGGDYAPFLTSITSIEGERMNGINSGSMLFDRNGNGWSFDNPSGGTAGTWVNIYEAYLDMPVSMGPLSGAEAQVGRFGNQFTKYTLKAINPDSYAAVPETSTGDYPMDGGKLVFSVGQAHVQLYAAKNDLTGDWVTMSAGPNLSAASSLHRPGSLTPGGANYQGLNAVYTDGDTFDDNEYVVDQSAGGRVTFGNPSNWVLGVTAVLTRINQFSLSGSMPFDPYQVGKSGTTSGVGKNYNNMAVYGVDFSGNLPFVKKSGLTLDGEAAETPTGIGSRWGNVNSSHSNQAFEANLGWATGPFSIKGGYQVVYSNFAAPGDWGHVATWINPVNVKGPTASASYVVSPKLTVSAEGKWYQGAQATPGGLITAGPFFQSPLTNTGDKLNHYMVGVKYGLTSEYSVDLGYEYDQWQLNDKYGMLNGPTGTHYSPTEQYITIGVGHSFNKNASVKMLYQILSYDDKKSGFDLNAITPGNLSGKEGGGVAITQFSVRF